MEARKVEVAHGLLWIKQGYWLFKKSPVLWIVLTAIATMGLVSISVIPLVGDPLATLLFPVVLAGLMLGCRALELGEELELSHLFGGFQSHAPQLVTLGGINLISQFLILGVMKLVGGAALVEIMMSGKPADSPEVLTQAVAGAGFALLLGMTLFSVLMMAMQFAPMLVIFGKMAPVPALKASLRAFVRNMLPLAVYGVVTLLLALLATMAMMLGWIVLLPVILASMYAIYRDLFPMQLETSAGAANTAATGGDQAQP
jgi:uncharacterized membrane protein